MAETAEHRDWKDDYRELEAKERDWQAADALLRRASSEVAIAAMGHGAARSTSAWTVFSRACAASSTPRRSTRRSTGSR